MNLRKLINDISKHKIHILLLHIVSDVGLISNIIVFMKEENILAIKIHEELINETSVYKNFKSLE